MYLMRKNRTSRAFALPTVLIASVVLLSVLAVSVTATAAVRTTLKNQYYTQLAQTAGESGVAFAKACLAANGNVPQWTNAKPLTPATDCSGNVVLSPNVKALVVAGGGSGGGSTGGGGGAGGVIFNNEVAIAATSYPVVVGNGGAATAMMQPGLNGSDSSFNDLVAVGGGGGGHSSNAPAASSGKAGGSGGGGQTNVGNTPPGAGTAGQGYAGASGGTTSAGGGGGAGGVGSTGTGANIGGNGGPGVQYNISGSMVYYGAGGGGGNGGSAGTGGNTTPSPSGGQAASGAANTGNGGTGGWAYADGRGGAGGSGVVIISYPINSGITATGGVISTSGGNRIHKFVASGTFTVTSAGTATCPSDPRCSVVVNDTVRSSFSVPRPSVDPVSGQALTIPNNGYVEVTRTSTGAVWRTYRQPSVQSAVVPDLCSGNATAARGWNAAVRSVTQKPIASISSAQTITLAASDLSAGVMYFRKDFNVSAAGTYDLNVYTAAAEDSALTYIDGDYVNTSNGSLASSQVTLTAGCHTIVTKLTNQTYLPRASDFTAAITRSGAATPLVISDTSWRVTAGDTAHFATNNYHETPGAWEPVLDMGVWNNAALPWNATPATWATFSGDSLTEWITTKNNTGGLNRPGNAYSWFRDQKPFTITAQTTLRVSMHCDDRCDLYLDGEKILSSNYSDGANFKNVTVQPGTHTFGIRLYNAASGNIAGILFAAVDTTSNQVIARSSPNWNSTTSWSTTATELYSFDTSFEPVPAIQRAANAKVLVVGGGGGGGSDMGGGGGGGAVIYNAAQALSPGNYSVTVGLGGAGGPAGTAQVRAANGQDSLFGTIRALGGGGGGSAYAVNTSPPGSGASAGGSAGANATLRASGVIGLGYDSVATLGSYYPTGGGGAGGPGAVNPATGGPGVLVDVLGTSYYFGGGGGGSGYTTIGGNGGIGGGGGGAVGTTTGGGTAINPGQPGGGGTTAAQTNRPGGNGGANSGGGGGGGSHYNSNNYGGNGGSGVVAIVIPNNTMSVSAPGAFVMTAIVPGHTVYMYNNVGNFTFTVNSIN